MSDTSSLVSVGLPTFNRVNTLQRAIESVLAQDYPNWELVISDNASTDDTEALCRRYSEMEPRILYVRQPENQGPEANFNFVQEQARGDFFLWLGDDDWIDARYLSRCVETLQANRDHVLVGGRPRYFRGEEFDCEGVMMSLRQRSGVGRVLAYYRQVDDNGIFYSVLRRDVLRQVPMPRRVLGGDWLFVASLVFRGKATLIDDVCVNRGLGGASASIESLTQHQELLAFRERHPYYSIAWFAFWDVVRVNPVYRSLPLLRRLRLGLGCALLICYRWIWPDVRHDLREDKFVRLVAFLNRFIPHPLYRAVRWLYRRSKSP